MEGLVGEYRVRAAGADWKVLDIGDDQVRASRAHALHADIQIRPADVEADRFHSAPVKPFRRPRVAAPAVHEDVPALEIQQREYVPEERDQVEGEGRVPGIEGGAVTGAEEAWLVDLVLERDFGVLMMRARIRRGVARGTEGREGAAEIVGKRGHGVVEQGRLAIGVAKMVREQFRDSVLDRKPSSALTARQQPRLNAELQPAGFRSR
jgi:hypothetical protein